MNLENKLINLLLESPKSEQIYNLAKKLEKDSKFNIKYDLETVTGIWELRWSSSSAPFLSYSPLISNLQILDPINSLGLNLLKPRGIKSIIGTGIVAELNPISEIRIGVRFIYAGLIGPKFGKRKIKAFAEIKKEQKGWLDITYLSKNLRICRGDKGTIFILNKINDETLFNKFQDFVRQFKKS
tara:strand:- start:53 stop:604 length:552 start_codon:yes stop_codon:yes gene_type:complete